MSDIQIEQSKSKKRLPPTDEFRLWLTSIGMINPTLHINGPEYTTAVMTVDFGTPLEEQKLSPEQTAELVSRMRNATKSVCDTKEANIRVQNDTNNGIWWSSIG